MFTSLLKSMIKDTDKQSDEERYRERPGRVLCSFCPCGVGVWPPSWWICYIWVCALLNSSLNPCISRTFMEASSYRHDQLLIPFSALFSSLEDGGLRLKILNITMTWFFWWPGPMQESFRGPHGVASVEQKALLVVWSLRKLQGFRSPESEMGSKTKDCNKRCSESSYHLRNYRSFGSSLTERGGKDQIYIFYYKSQYHSNKDREATYISGHA